MPETVKNNITSLVLECLPVESDVSIESDPVLIGILLSNDCSIGSLTKSK